jgi:hypothetical protein
MQCVEWKETKKKKNEREKTNILPGCQRTLVEIFQYFNTQQRQKDS